MLQFCYSLHVLAVTSILAYTSTERRLRRELQSILQAHQQITAGLTHRKKTQKKEMNIKGLSILNIKSLVEGNDKKERAT